MIVSDKQMTLGELISTLKRKYAEVVTFDFVHFNPKGINSYRGHYEDLAVGYSTDECKLEDFISLLERANGATFSGWKGGDYTMHDGTPVWVADYGESGGTAIVDVIDDGYRVILKTEMVD